MAVTLPKVRPLVFATIVGLGAFCGCSSKPKDGDRSPEPTDAMNAATAATEANFLAEEKAARKPKR